MERDREYGHVWVAAEALLDGPKTADEVAEYFQNYLRFAGMFAISGRMRRRRRRNRTAQLVETSLDDAVSRGWAVTEGERYALTERGQAEASKILADMRRARAVIATLLEPVTVSKASLAVHVFLAALKLPAALLSGSVALLNDGVDTLLDGASSILVFLGLRWNRERSANVLLVLFMLGTGGWTLAEAIASFLAPQEMTVDWIAFAAAAVSAVLCAGLWAYQRYIGLRSGSIALITQSIDSRNHVIVAGGVLAGLVASLLHFAWLDRIVGLIIALLILKSAIELLVDVIRTRGEEEIDLSRYRFGPGERYGRLRDRQFRDWLIVWIADREPIARDTLVQDVVETLDFRRMPTLHALGIADAHRVTPEDVRTTLDELIRQGSVADEAGLTVTADGRRAIRRWLRP